MAAFLDLKNLKREYLFYYLSTLTGHLRDRIAAGADQPNLNTTRIGNIKIPTPPIEEQNIIVDKMLQLDSSIKLCKVQLDSTRTLLNSFINQVF